MCMFQRTAGHAHPHWRYWLINLLSVGQLEVLKLISEGLNNKEIASIVHVQPQTVMAIAHKIYELLGLLEEGKYNLRVRAAKMYWEHINEKI